MIRKWSLHWLYDVLLKAYGLQGWWPGDREPLAVCLGALLVQRTTWHNASNALDGLAKADMLCLEALDACPTPQLSERIRSVGFHNAKAAKLKAFAEYMLNRWGGSFALAKQSPRNQLREELLEVHGIGPETADAMLTYAFGIPSFVIDAYTRRILRRIGWIDGEASYPALQETFEAGPPQDVAYYGEYHALLVEHAKRHCRKTPWCGNCPLEADCASVHGKGQRP